MKKQSASNSLSGSSHSDSCSGGSGDGRAGASAPFDRVELTGRLTPVTGEMRRSLDLTVPFARDSARLTEASREQFDELAVAITGEKLKKFRVEVNINSHGVNLDKSGRRVASDIARNDCFGRTSGRWIASEATQEEYGFKCT